MQSWKSQSSQETSIDQYWHPAYLERNNVKIVFFFFMGICLSRHFAIMITVLNGCLAILPFSRPSGGASLFGTLYYPSISSVADLAVELLVGFSCRPSWLRSPLAFWPRGQTTGCGATWRFQWLNLWHEAFVWFHHFGHCRWSADIIHIKSHCHAYPMIIIMLFAF